MTELEKKLKSALRRFGIGPADRIVAAVSGGADSTAMLDALARLRGQTRSMPSPIIAAHLNHLLRGEDSDRDEAFVIAMAEKYQLPVFTDRIPIADHARENRINLEAVARQFRYTFLQKIAEENDAGFVFTAHTRDDQAETVLMRLLRGAGPEGLRGVHPIRPLGKRVKLVRALIEVSRVEIIAHCEHYGIEFRTDNSNFSGDLMRNRIRHELLPLMRTFNPRSDEALVRIARLVSEDNEYLDQLSSELLASSLEEPDQTRGNRLNIIRLASAHPAIRFRVLRYWIRNVRGNLREIDSKHLAAIERLISQGQSGRSVELPGLWIIVREFDWLKLVRASELEGIKPPPIHLTAGSPRIFGNYEFRLIRHHSHTEAQPFAPSGGEAALIRETAGLDHLTLRARSPGDAYTPAGSHNKIKLKILLIRNKIPVSLRDTHPVLVSADNDIIWSPGLPVAQDFVGREGDDDYALIIAQKVV